MHLAVLIWDLSDHHVNDILCQIVVAARDENLGTRKFVGAVSLLHRFGLHQAQIGAAMRFSQTHRACPFSAHHLRHDVFTHPGRACRDER